MTTSRLTSLSERYRQRLVEQLQKKGAIRSTRLAQAFARIPREEFVSVFYDRSSGQQIWERYTSENMEPEDWLAIVYQDKALVTQLTSNAPTSSSSMPSIMAQMLEALDIQRGQQVLEIGTGTGYNAALMAELVQDPTLITTIDLNEDLVSQARQILQRVVGQVYVEARDGTQGEVSHAPYDRIIVTASAAFIPQAWYQQLAPGGRLVTALQGTLGASGFMIVEKASDGRSALGRFLETPLHFMPLRTPEVSPLASARELFQQPVGSEVQLQPEHYFLTLLQNNAFRWFLQWWWPGTIKINQAVMTHTGRREPIIILMDQDHQTILQLKQDDDGWWRGKHHGSFPLWKTIEQALEQFATLGKPEHWLYQVQMDEQAAQLQICDVHEQVHFICDLYQN